MFLPSPPACLVRRQSKPRNRPSFRQTLMHLDIASADVLATPQETYFKSQVPAAPRGCAGLQGPHCGGCTVYSRGLDPWVQFDSQGEGNWWKSKRSQTDCSGLSQELSTVPCTSPRDC